MEDESDRSRIARRAAETALVRVVHHYGARPEFVVIGGLVPALLCGDSGILHAGTTDVDVQVDLEIGCGAANAVRLETALKNAEFEPTNGRIWRWVAGSTAVVKFELLADLETHPAGGVVSFDGCEHLGAVNLRGTRFAARDAVPASLRGRVGEDRRVVEVNVAGLAGFLLAKASAAHSRHKPKDWYDAAFVLLHNNAGGPRAAARAVRAAFPGELVGAVRTALDELAANFERPAHQGPQAYAAQMLVDYPDLSAAALQADAVLAVDEFYRALFSPG